MVGGSHGTGQPPAATASGGGRPGSAVVVGLDQADNLVSRYYDAAAALPFSDTAGAKQASWLGFPRILRRGLFWLRLDPWVSCIHVIN